MRRVSDAVCVWDRVSQSPIRPTRCPRKLELPVSKSISANTLPLDSTTRSVKIHPRYALEMTCLLAMQNVRLNALVNTLWSKWEGTRRQSVLIVCGSARSY